MAATYSLRMSSSARLNQPVSRAYATLIAGLTRTSPPLWLFDARKAPSPVLGKDDEFVVTRILSRCFNRRVSCWAHFRMRERDMPDHSTRDDWFDLSWKPKPEDYSEFISVVLPKYISMFRPYRVTLGPETMRINDWFEVFNERELNGRYQVGRICPVDFISGDLCRSAFGKTPEQCVRTLRKSEVPADEFKGGLLIRVPALLSPAECDDFHGRVSKLIVPKRKVSRRK